MTQGLFAGMTDYSNQSFQDILEDLDKFLQMSEETVNFILTKVESIKEYWDRRVDYDFSGTIGHALKFYQTVVTEIKEIANEIQVNVRNDHHKRLKKLGEKAIEVNHKLGEVWHSDTKYRYFGETGFSVVETIYNEARDTAASLMDISNLASRLEDFVGKTGSPKKTAIEEGVLDIDFVNKTRIDELQSVQNSPFDLCRLIQLCEEINLALKKNSFLTVAILTRAIIDHVPPIFNAKNFNEIANNYNLSKSFKDSMSNLNNSTRKIADSFLHTHIRNKESLPNYTQVNCSQDLDVLLAEVYRILK
jgi:hypothetical protein